MVPWKGWQGFSEEDIDGDDLAGKEWVPMAVCLRKALPPVREGTDQASLHLVILILHNFLCCVRLCVHYQDTK